MGYEIDFTAVGNDSQSGDAIAVRYGNLHGPRDEQTIIVIDGGFKASGEKLAKHIRTYYDEGGVVDLVVSTHPDQDHISGLTTIIEELDVRELWMHLPWDHEEETDTKFFRGGRLVFKGITPEQKSFERSLQAAQDLYDLATEKGIPVVETFQGHSTPDGALRVLGPGEAYYEQLVSESDRSLLVEAATLLKRAAERVVESFSSDGETLDDGGETSPQNNSSTILLLDIGGRRALFTADAGIPALTRAANYAQSTGIDLQDCWLLQVPHHGSRRNVGPAILDSIVGPCLEDEDEELMTKRACVSAAPDGAPKHPSKRVTNAFYRRGAKVAATRGNSLCWSHDAPDRRWSSVEFEEFHENFEE